MEDESRAGDMTRLKLLPGKRSWRVFEELDYEVATLPVLGKFGDKIAELPGVHRTGYFEVSARM